MGRLSARQRVDRCEICGCGGLRYAISGKKWKLYNTLLMPEDFNLLFNQWVTDGRLEGDGDTVNHMTRERFFKKLEEFVHNCIIPSQKSPDLIIRRNGTIIKEKKL